MANFTLMVLSQDPACIKQDSLIEYLCAIPHYPPQEYEIALTASHLSFELIGPGGKESKVSALYYRGEIDPGLPGHPVHLVVVDEFSNYRMRDEFARQFGLYLAAERLDRHGHCMTSKNGYLMAGYTYEGTSLDITHRMEARYHTHH